jgi:hypothetical protein
MAEENEEQLVKEMPSNEATDSEIPSQEPVAQTGDDE